MVVHPTTMNLMDLVINVKKTVSHVKMIKIVTNVKDHTIYIMMIARRNVQRNSTQIRKITFVLLVNQLV